MGRILSGFEIFTLLTFMQLPTTITIMLESTTDHDLIQDVTIVCHETELLLHAPSDFPLTYIGKGEKGDKGWRGYPGQKGSKGDRGLPGYPGFHGPRGKELENHHMQSLVKCCANEMLYQL